MEFRRAYSYKEYDLVRCASCGLGMLFPPPKLKAEDYYGKAYYLGECPEGLGFNVLDARAIAESRIGMAAKIDWLLARRKISNLLDIGCGIGLLVEAAQKRGIHAEGIDLSSFAVEYGSRELHIRGLKAGDFTTVLDAKKTFDVVYLNHVIEHVPDPVRFVEDCCRYLSPGGWLVLETPDIDSTQAKRAGKNWEYILTEHLYYFNLATLAQLVENQGLSVRYAEKEVGSPGLLHAICGDKDKAKMFHDRWLSNPPMQFCIRLVRSLYRRMAQQMEVDYKFIKLVAEKAE